MKYADIGRAIDYLHDFPDKKIILDIDSTDVIDWNLIENINGDNLILCIKNLEMAKICKEHNVKFYWNYDIISFYELRGVISLEPEYICLGAPLSFDLIKVKNITDIKIRLCPNQAQDLYIPREDGVCGQWIRPEDTKYYDEYVDVFEFITDTLEYERVLFKVYAEDQKWPGNLNLLINGLNKDVPNASLPDEFADLRISCGQSCMKNNRCKFCYRAINFANAVRKEYYSRLKQRIAADKEASSAQK